MTFSLPGVEVLLLVVLRKEDENGDNHFYSFPSDLA